jgi:hypothetical protein
LFPAVDVERSFYSLGRIIVAPSQFFHLVPVVVGMDDVGRHPEKVRRIFIEFSDVHQEVETKHLHM